MPQQPDRFGVSSPVRLDPAPNSPGPETLAAYPHVSSETLNRHAKRIGRAGEFFVDSILTRYGDLIFAAPEDQPFDRLVTRDDRVVTLQIKTSSRAVDGVFRFSMKKGYNGSPNGVRAYDVDDYDIAALVALPENVVLFSADRRASHRIGLDEIEALRADPRASYLRALDVLELTRPAVAEEAHPAPFIPAL